MTAKNADGMWCYWCQTKPADGWDHLIPKTRGGSNMPENLVPSCTTCNTRKSNRTPAEYGAWLRRQAATMATICPVCASGPGEWCVKIQPASLRERRHKAINLHPQRKEAAA